MLINTSIGALHTERRFLAKNSRADNVISASRPAVKVSVASVSPMTVRYWKCQPYASLLSGRVNQHPGYSRPRTWGAYALLGFSCMLENGWLVGGPSTGEHEL